MDNPRHIDAAKWSPLVATNAGENGGTIAFNIATAMMAAESAFGPINGNYFFAGFEFCQDNPRLRYIGGHVVMQITESALSEPAETIFQLSHEVVHLLSPSGDVNTTVLEEGVATHFSEYYTLRKTGQSKFAGLKSYIDARNLVWQLLTIDKYAIKKLRELEPRMFKITAGHIKSCYPQAPDALVHSLAAQFVR